MGTVPIFLFSHFLSLDHYGRNLRITHHPIEIRDVSAEQKIQLTDLRVRAAGQFSEDLVRRSGRTRIGTAHHRGLGRQLVVQQNGEIQGILSTLGLGLNQDVFDGLQLFINPAALGGDPFHFFLTFNLVQHIMDLLFQIPHLNDGSVNVCQFIPDLDQKIELELEISL